MSGPADALREDLHAAIAKRAASYALRQRMPDWRPDDQSELDEWLAQSYLHQAAYLRCAGGVARFQSLAAFRDVGAAESLGTRLRRRAWVPFLAAASIVLIAMLAFPTIREWLQPADRTFATNVGGRATLKFSDGTEIELNTDTALRYRMTTQERSVWLEKGEAYFRVAHNAANPFNVIVEGHRVTDLGTEFLVRDDAGGVDVALLKGRAKLTTDRSGSSVAMLTPGDEAVATSVSTTITKRSMTVLNDELAWQRGVLIFRNAKLGDAVREINRYCETKLVITDPEVANLKVSAEIKSDNSDDFLQLVKDVLNLRIRREGNEVLIFRKFKQ